jgi:hypothetical protein
MKKKIETTREEDHLFEVITNAMAKAQAQMPISRIVGVLEWAKAAAFEFHAQRCRALQARDLIAKSQKMKNQ